MMSDPSRDATNLAEQEFSLLDIFYAIWKRKYVPIGLSLFFGGLAFLAGMRSPKIYQSDALIQIERKDRRTPGGVVTQTSDILTLANPAQADIGIVKSRLVLGEVVRKHKLNIGVSAERSLTDRLLRRTSPDLEIESFTARTQGVDGHFRLVLTSEKGDLELTQPDGTTILKAKIGVPVDSASNPLGVAMLVRDVQPRAVGSVFWIRMRNEHEAISELGSALDVEEIGTETGVLLLTLSGGDPDRVAAMLNGIAEAFVRQDIHRRTKEVRNRVEFLETKLPELLADLQESEDSLRAYQLRVGSVDIAQEVSNSLQQQTAIRQQVLQLQQKRSESLGQFKEDHPAIRTLDSTLGMLRAREAALEAASLSFPMKQLEILRRTRSVQVNAERYEEVLREAQHFRVIMDQQMGSARIVDHALPAMAPQPSKRKKLLILGVFGGFGFGCAIAFALQVFASGIGSPRRIEGILRSRILALLPRTSARRALERELHSDPDRTGRPLPLPILFDPTHPYSEALRGLLPSLRSSIQSARNNILVVTSPSKVGGHDLIALQIAILFERAGVKVALVDANLRNGRLHAALGVARAPGISDLASRNTETSAAMHGEIATNLTFVSKGRESHTPFDIIQSPAFGDMLQKLSTEHEIVVLNSPPILAASDTQFLANAAGSALLVLEHEESTANDLDQTRRKLEQSGTRLLGVILDAIPGLAPINGMPFFRLMHQYPTRPSA